MRKIGICRHCGMRGPVTRPQAKLPGHCPECWQRLRLLEWVEENKDAKRANDRSHINEKRARIRALKKKYSEGSVASDGSVSSG